MKLIVDSGSTKANWCFAGQSGERVILDTDGINPAIQTRQSIRSILVQQLIPQVGDKNVSLDSVDDVFFYGAGCMPQTKSLVSDELCDIMKQNVKVHVESDLLGAARALCGRRAGIAAILGTGANSCFYDGEDIVAHTPALGYILGDEGSGAVLGRLFLNAVLKGKLSAKVSRDFFAVTGYTEQDIIERVYHSETPSKFLASMSRFIFERIGCAELENMVIDNFISFIKANILPYSDAPKVINAVGSIAYYYKPQLMQAADYFGYNIGNIAKSPISLMVDYHMNN